MRIALLYLGLLIAIGVLSSSIAATGEPSATPITAETAGSSIRVAQSARKALHCLWIMQIQSRHMKKERRSYTSLNFEDWYQSFSHHLQTKDW